MKPKTLARIEILNFITVFCVAKYFGGDSFSTYKDKSLQGDYFHKQYPPIGSLISLQSAPFTKYYLSWLHEIQDSDSRFGMRYLLESIEDGSLCWWSNVGVWSFPKEMTDQYPEWRWTDDQFAFKKRWLNACYKKRDAYITLPTYPIFFEDGSVTLGTRERFNMSNYRAEKKFDNWKKVKVADMLDFYDEAVKNKPINKVSEPISSLVEKP